jgi:hypothetical protein
MFQQQTGKLAGLLAVIIYHYHYDDYYLVEMK